MGKLAPVLSVVVLDAIKETLFDTLGTGDRDWSKKLGVTTFELLYMLIEGHLKARQSVLVEAGFHNKYATSWLDEMRQKYDFDVLELHCYADPDTVRQRYFDRARSDERHPGHDSGVELETFAEELHDRYAEYGPVVSGDRLIRIDTTDFTVVDYGEIIERVKVALPRV